MPQLLRRNKHREIIVEPRGEAQKEPQNEIVIKETLRGDLTVSKKETGIRRVTDGDIAWALKETKGFISKAAEKIGISPSAVYARINASEVLREVKQEIEESLLDTAEIKLSDAVNESKPWAICFYLKCKGKRRGYTENAKEDIETPEEKAYKVKQVLDAIMDIAHPKVQ
jgi:hypothetical protein